jgi:hypothetical protein
MHAGPNVGWAGTANRGSEGCLAPGKWPWRVAWISRRIWRFGQLGQVPERGHLGSCKRFHMSMGWEHSSYALARSKQGVEGLPTPYNAKESRSEIQSAWEARIGAGQIIKRLLLNWEPFENAMLHFIQ